MRRGGCARHASAAPAPQESCLRVSGFRFLVFKSSGLGFRASSFLISSFTHLVFWFGFRISVCFDFLNSGFGPQSFRVWRLVGECDRVQKRCQLLARPAASCPSRASVVVTCAVWGLELWCGFAVLRIRSSGFGFRVSYFGFRVSCSGFRVGCWRAPRIAAQAAPASLSPMWFGV